MLKFSVVIPAYNEEAYIERTLNSLKHQTLKPYEIIVVDNNSTDKTAKIAELMDARVLFEKEKGIGPTRDKGFREAKGDIIATSDADTTFPADWLLRIKKEFEKDSKVVAVGGPYKFDTEKKKNTIKILTKIVIFMDKLVNLGKSNIPGANASILKNAYLRAGGYKEKYFEDLGMSLRLKKLGKVIFLKDLWVTTSYRRYEEKGLFKTLFTYMKNYLNFKLFRKVSDNFEDIRHKK